uniref:Uncharacterized protein n=1 Tax=Pyxicephalus adspersus TaxID=30357 RepID=A0AAV3B3I2_PYXAD|nr:TPA: hypothetical protein GDO54_009514 [Pyxicephalus adspersus]
MHHCCQSRIDKEQEGMICTLCLKMVSVHLYIGTFIAKEQPESRIVATDYSRQYFICRQSLMDRDAQWFLISFGNSSSDISL